MPSKHGSLSACVDGAIGAVVKERSRATGAVEQSRRKRGAGAVKRRERRRAVSCLSSYDRAFRFRLVRARLETSLECRRPPPHCVPLDSVAFRCIPLHSIPAP